MIIKRKRGSKNRFLFYHTKTPKQKKEKENKSNQKKKIILCVYQNSLTYLE